MKIIGISGEMDKETNGVRVTYIIEREEGDEIQYQCFLKAKNITEVINGDKCIRKISYLPH